MQSYCSRPMESLAQSEDAICAKKYRFREDIDKDFFGSSGLRQTRNMDVEERIKEWVEARLDRVEAGAFGGVRRRLARFPRREFRRDLTEHLEEAPSAVGGITLFMVLYYIVVALYWWRKLR